NHKKEIYQYTEETNKKNNIEDRYNQDKDFLEKIYIKLDEKHYINSLYNLAKYFANHWVLLLVLCGIIGAFILMKYFALDINYTPIITQEYALYLIFVTGIIGIAYASLVFLYPIFFIYFIQKTQEESKRYWSKWDIIFFAISINITPLYLALVVFINIFEWSLEEILAFVPFVDRFSISLEWSLEEILALLCFFEFIIFIVIFAKNSKNKFNLIYYVLTTAFIIFFFYFLFIFLLIGYNSTWQDFLILNILFFIYDFILICIIIGLNFSIINPHILTIILVFILPILTFSSSNIVSILKLGNYDLKSLSISPNASSNYQKNCDFTVTELKDEIILKNVHILSNIGEKVLLACESGESSVNKNDLISEINKISNKTNELVLKNGTSDIPSICNKKNDKEKIILKNIRVLDKNENSVKYKCISSNIVIESNSVINSIYKN
ncbi:TPA: hypothetical protein SG786_001598, partial [Campylobacter coli]|nr:hypothetical protein [Campylobacter coli]